MLQSNRPSALHPAKCLNRNGKLHLMRYIALALDAEHVGLCDFSDWYEKAVINHWHGLRYLTVEADIAFGNKKHTIRLDPKWFIKANVDAFMKGVWYGV
jgi:hypothetical protein